MSIGVLGAGLSGVLASVALELVDDLLAPTTSIDSSAARKVAVNGAVIVTYMLDVAARRKPLGDAGSRGAVVDTVPIGLSLLGLMLLGIFGKHK